MGGWVGEWVDGWMGGREIASFQPGFCIFCGPSRSFWPESGQEELKLMLSVGPSVSHCVGYTGLERCRLKKLGVRSDVGLKIKCGWQVIELVAVTSLSESIYTQ